SIGWHMRNIQGQAGLIISGRKSYFTGAQKGNGAILFELRVSCLANFLRIGDTASIF
ncbi:uncharacterized protein METZ01_LOCUS168773, partial [marine metagenome]